MQASGSNPMLRRKHFPLIFSGPPCRLKSQQTSPVTGVFDCSSHAFLISDSLESEHMLNVTRQTAEISGLIS